jgi:superfamily II DNA helicase RecQ
LACYSERALQLLPVRDIRDAEELEALLREYEGRRTSDRERLELMMRYAQTAHCRTRYIQRYFGEESSEDCGHCDNCAGGKRPAPQASRPKSAAKAARERARLERLIASAVGNVRPDGAS